MSRWQKAGKNQLMDALLYQTVQCEGKLVNAIVPYGVIFLVIIGFPEQPGKDSRVFSSFHQGRTTHVIHKSTSSRPIAMRCRDLLWTTCMSLKVYSVTEAIQTGHFAVKLFLHVWLVDLFF